MSFRFLLMSFSFLLLSSCFLLTLDLLFLPDLLYPFYPFLPSSSQRRLPLLGASKTKTALTQRILLVQQV